MGIHTDLKGCCSNWDELRRDSVTVVQMLKLISQISVFYCSGYSSYKHTVLYMCGRMEAMEVLQVRPIRHMFETLIIMILLRFMNSNYG